MPGCLPIRTIDTRKIQNVKILFIHQNFPGQYKNLAPLLAEQGHHVLALCDEKFSDFAQAKYTGFKVLGYKSPHEPVPGTHLYLHDTTWAVRRGQAVARVLLQLKNQSWIPDVIYAHTGWGEAMFVKDVFPAVPLVGYFEYYYKAQNADLGFDPEFPADLNVVLRGRIKNAVNLLSMEACDYGITPTAWQASTYPAWFQPKLHVIHEGVDTNGLQPKRIDTLSLPGVDTIQLAVTPLITFVNRNLEPTRGFHIMMRALPHLQAALPQAHVIMVGGDNIGYGLPHESGKSYRDVLTAELGSTVNWAKVHFVGDLPYDQFVGLLQAATVHVYLTIPFVLSWSLLEAMALGKAIVASDTLPVQEVLEHETTGLLTPFLEPERLAATIDGLVKSSQLRETLGQAARQHVVAHFDLQQVCLPKHLHLLKFITCGGVA